MHALQYTVDIVLCIDGTGSMSPIIDAVKSRARKFYEDLSSTMQRKNKVINTLRVRVVVFRDYYYDGEFAMEQSPFFTLPAEQTAFAKFIDQIQAEGGGEDPENGLEALALAIKSPWNAAGDKKRQIIVLWTDAPAHPLEAFPKEKPADYPKEMPANFDALTDLWDSQFISRHAKRLILYAPDAYAWTDIANHWENVIQHPSKAGEGLSDVDYGTILDAIANSV